MGGWSGLGASHVPPKPPWQVVLAQPEHGAHILICTTAPEPPEPKRLILSLLEKEHCLVGIKTLHSQKREKQKVLNSAGSCHCINTETWHGWMGQPGIYCCHGVGWVLFPQQLLWDKDTSPFVPPLSPEPSSWQVFPREGRGIVTLRCQGATGRRGDHSGSPRWPGLCITARYYLSNPNPALPAALLPPRAGS